MKHTAGNSFIEKALTLSLLCSIFLFAKVKAADDVVKVIVKRTVAYSEESVRIGRSLFTLNCPACHGQDGKAQIDFVADATNLTDPEQWRNGTNEQVIFQSISEGSGTDMPPFKYLFSNNDDIWHLINWITSNWTKKQRDTLLKARK